MSPSQATGGFDFTLHVGRLCADIAARLPELRHIDMRKVAVRFCQIRKGVSHGTQASLTPLRFAHGERTTVRRGQTWTIQRVLDSSGQEMLYLLSFYLPRFLDRPLDDKLSTVFHELWHISPRFDGDVRRLPGRCYAHGANQQAFHAEMGPLVERWLALSPPEETYAFLRHDFRQLVERHGPVYGTKYPTPKLVRVDPPGKLHGPT
jgi:predicted metallopeptidase